MDGETNGRTQRDTNRRRHEGTKARRHEGTKTRKHRGIINQRNGQKKREKVIIKGDETQRNGKIKGKEITDKSTDGFWMDLSKNSSFI